MRRAGLLITIILATLTLRWDACAQKPTDVSEDAAKAICIYNFAVFVDWPATTFVNADYPFVIGVLGDDTFAGDLDKAINDKKAQGRKLVVRKLKWNKDLKDSKDLKDCHLLYIAATESIHGDEIIQMRKGTPILTIALSVGYASINTFSRGFREVVGMTPSAWREAKLGASETPDAAGTGE
jgi:AraC-like DNA-binding protein